ncbi:MAG: glucose-6-phosphate isomerase [Limnobacter sp.]|uniref:glucose-6-phosphate isomerase n=1 Tax=Limnobacter sp. TaxID=2003368 RepID=UPI00391CA224
MSTLNASPLHVNLERQHHWQAAQASHAHATERITQGLKALFTGQVVNPSEQRAAGHWALRAAQRRPQYPQWVGLNHQGTDVLAQAQEVENRLLRTIDDIRAGRYTTSTGQTYDSVLHLGIGGSDLGPRLLHQVFSALGLNRESPIRQARFVANVDYHEMKAALDTLNPERTLVIVASKSFSTRETLNNLAHIRRWLEQVSTQHCQRSILAATCKPNKAIDSGIAAEQVFEFSETVGGRYSLWGPVSMAIRLIHGNQAFTEFLDGAAAMDVHCLNTPAPRNLVVQLALADAANLAAGLESLMLSPYDSRLGLLVPYLQQLWMESLGKGVTTNGAPLTDTPCPVLWGDVGTNGQHAFFQMLHQAPLKTAIEILAVAVPDHSEAETHDLLLSHALAQAEAFSSGKLNTLEQAKDPAVNFRTCPGQRPVTFTLMSRLTPHALGALLALWEHRTVALAVVQGINPFDQWGVELGKVISEDIAEELRTRRFHSDNPQTRNLMTLLEQVRHANA